MLPTAKWLPLVVLSSFAGSLSSFGASRSERELLAGQLCDGYNGMLTVRLASKFFPLLDYDFGFNGTVWQMCV